ncbi:MAG TPA: alpha/beta hydrolase [Methanospirillum sp.]|nr:alpha/beta hydrolase [Methanospirillum sp.]
MNDGKSDLINDSLSLSYASGNCRISYRVIGHGSPMILIMGLGGTMNEWDRTFLTILSNQYRLILFDNRGIGDSTDTDARLMIESMAVDVKTLMVSLDIPHATILGYSMGAMIALEIAVRYPGLIDHLILYGPSMDGFHLVDRLAPYIDTGRPELILIDALFPHEWLSSKSDLSQIFPPPVHKINRIAIFRQIGAMQDWKMDNDTISTIPIPTLILSGSIDCITPASEGDKISRLIKRSMIIQVPGGGHGMMYQFPKTIAEHILKFLKEEHK